MAGGYPVVNQAREEGQAAGHDFDRLAVTNKCRSVYISSATTTADIASGPCILRSITIGETAAGAITIYNALTATGETVAVLKASIAERTYFFDRDCDIGLTIVTAAASKLSVQYVPVAP